jgi:Flp pilus assembly protein TadG
MTRRRRPPRDQHGQSSVEAAIIAVGVLALCFLPVAFGVYFHDTSVATAAAQEAARAARTGQGDPTATANNYLDRVGSGLTDRQVSVSENPDTVCVHVDGYATIIIPGIRIPVHARSAGVRERFRPENPNYQPNVNC